MPKRKYKPEPSFQHKRLKSPRSIRLLNLYPAPEVSTPLNLTLSEFSLDGFSSTTQNYEALSYVWGARTGTIPCTCDGHELLITPNCNEALQNLRYTDRERVLWVDAICIDQGASEESVNERNLQIKLMGEIYGNAERTLCWLGGGKEYTAGLFERLRKIGTFPSKRELKKLSDFDHRLHQQGKLEAESTSLNDIFCHSWHTRVWTVQEVAFSKDCQIVCGKEIIPWSIYHAAAQFLIVDELLDELDAQAWKNYLSIMIRNDLHKFLTKELVKDENEWRMKFLTSALTQVRHLQATNPKDKIYGLYAAFSALGVSLPPPDYEKTREKIYEEACVAIIKQSGSLRILDYACSNTRSVNLPSWVADWEDGDVTLENLPTQATEESRIPQEYRSTLSPTGGKLHLRGKFVGSIQKRAINDFSQSIFPASSLPILKGSDYEFIGNEVETLRNLIHIIKLFREWMPLLDKISLPMCDGENSSTFHRLVTFDSKTTNAHIFNAWVDILQHPSTSYDLSYGAEMVRRWKETDNNKSWTQELTYCATIAASVTSRSAKKDGQIPLEAAGFLNIVPETAGRMSNRALILTHDDGLNTTVPGTAFHTAAIGDYIVLLEGADTPVVLRRKGKEWLFVGPAYVLGIMDGEAWSDEDGVVVGLEDFMLI